MSGHVFVVPGNLESLLCDDVLVSSDYRGEVGRPFWPVFDWSDEEGPRLRSTVGRYESGRRVFRASDESAAEGPRRWVVDVGATAGAAVSWLLAGVREALAAVAESAPDVESYGPRRRIAMPVMGVGGGGFDGKRGEVIHGLLDEAQHAVDRFDVDVVLVARNPSDYSAFQALRAGRHTHSLTPEHEQSAQRLARLATEGRLAVFMGAGTGIAAGLPSWEQLLARLAEIDEIPDPKALQDLGPLDAAELLRRKAQARAKASGTASWNSLGHDVARVIGHPTRYALSHAFLAALNADQVITTNFDRLYELAVEAVRGPQKIDPSEALSHEGGRFWLLKLHGDVENPDSIVLDRRSFVRFDAWRRPLGGVVQATLLTRHLLVVGASMTDDNVIRLVHEVAELVEQRGRVPALGTVLSLVTDPLRAELWRPEFEFLDLSNDGSLDLSWAARELEIFLDRVALLSAPQSAHLLDPRYRELLGSDEEKQLAARLNEVAGEIQLLSGLAGANPGWSEIAGALAVRGSATD